MEDSGIGEVVDTLRNKYPQILNPQDPPKGLYMLSEWITEEEERELVTFLCGRQWSNNISSKRPTQHFGYLYTIQGYSSSKEKTADVKDWGIIRKYADKIEQEFPGIKIAQCLANLYFKDSAIGSHRDRETPVVFGLSLSGDINMVWTEIKTKRKYTALIPRRSLYIMCDDAAFDWKHEVPSLKTVTYPEYDHNNPKYGKLANSVTKPDWYTRVSLTFRHFIQPLNDK